MPNGERPRSPEERTAILKELKENPIIKRYEELKLKGHLGGKEGKESFLYDKKIGQKEGSLLYDVEPLTEKEADELRNLEEDPNVQLYLSLQKESREEVSKTSF